MTETRREYSPALSCSLSIPVFERPETYHDTPFTIYDKHWHLLLRSHLAETRRERNHSRIEQLAAPEAILSSRTNILRSKQREVSASARRQQKRKRLVRS